MDPSPSAKRQCVDRIETTEATEASRDERARLAADLHLEGELEETISRALAAAAASGRWISYKRIFKRMASKWRRTDSFVGMEKGLLHALQLTKEPCDLRKLYKNLCNAMRACPRPSVDKFSAMASAVEMAAYSRLRSLLIDLLVSCDNPASFSHAIEVLATDFVAPPDGSCASDLTGRSDLFDVVCAIVRKGPVRARKFACARALHDLILVANPTYTPMAPEYLEALSRLYAEFPLPC